jgi:TPR repeat protein
MENPRNARSPAATRHMSIILPLAASLFIMSGAAMAAPPAPDATLCPANYPLARSDSKAKLEMGLRYIYSIGVERDHVRALMWFYMADAGDPNAARPYVMLLEPRMTKNQVANAHELADYALDNGLDVCP